MYEAVEISWVSFFKRTHKGVLPQTTYVHTLIHRVTIILQGVIKMLNNPVDENTNQKNAEANVRGLDNMIWLQQIKCGKGD